MVSAASPAAFGARTVTLQDLYQSALKEGGTLTVYAGGDEVTQGFGIKAGFEKQFPGMKLDIVVDLSKYHDARIEEELLRKDLKVDVAHVDIFRVANGKIAEHWDVMQAVPAGAVNPRPMY